MATLKENYLKRKSFELAGKAEVVRGGGESGSATRSFLRNFIVPSPLDGRFGKSAILDY